MKTKLHLIASFAILLSVFTSCIKDEPLYMEAEIEDFRFADSTYLSTSITDGMVNIMVEFGTDLSDLNPIVNISPNATIIPSPDSIRDYREDVEFTVTSEDKAYSRVYKVHVLTAPRVMKFDFEDWEMESNNNYPLYKDPLYPFWDNANKGVWFAGVTDKPYPTRDTTDAYSGNKAALLETVKGKRVIIINIPIFSATLFTGEFKTNALQPLKSTRFGQIHPKESGRPIKMTGYYKYTPGPEFTVNGKVDPNQTDSCDIYAVLYEVTKGDAGMNEYLDGGNITTSNKIALIARLEDGSAQPYYTKFTLPFVELKPIDYEQYDYKLAIVFASSRRGANYQGAIGSKLIIDDVEVSFQSY